jgi:SAM-dependent methyltransferase
VDALFESLGLDAGDSSVLDLAAGTGKLTRVLMRVAGSVVAVEPSEAMRARLPAEVTALDGTAEALPLADGAVDAVFSGEAFHWFDGPRAVSEIARVLRPGGGVALLWNVAVWSAETHPWLADMAAVVERFRAPGVTEENRYGTGLWRRAFEASDAFGPLGELQVEHAQPQSREEFVGQVMSWSFMAALGADSRAAAADALRAVVPPQVTVPWRTDAYWARLR